MDKQPLDDIAALDLSKLPEGEVFRPMEQLSPGERDFLRTWETPMVQWSAFNVRSGMVLEKENNQRRLRFDGTFSGAAERELVTGDESLRDAVITAVCRPLGGNPRPHMDSRDCRETLAGILFRMHTTRFYYQFGIEGGRRLVLYRRRDDEWLALAAREVALPDTPVTLVVDLDADGIEASCPELGVTFQVTDTMYSAGKAGFRTLGETILFDLRVQVRPWQGRRNRLRRQALEKSLRKRADQVPPPVLVDSLDLGPLGGSPVFCDFAVPGRNDMLVVSRHGLRALDHSGKEEMWRLDQPVVHHVLSRSHDGERGRLIYILTGSREMMVVRGTDGEVLARAETPPEEGRMRHFDWSPGSACLQDPQGFDIVLREWRDDMGMGGGGCRLWAFDRHFRQLWFHRQEGAHYGHNGALAFHDVTGDGREELLAGGYLYRGDGSVLWRHDRVAEMVAVHGAVHYDAVALGCFAGDEEVDPVAFLLGGTAGVYVVDGKTGRTRAVHRIGHAQGRVACNLRPDLPGSQLLAVTRWGSYGIITLLAGDGSRLWSIQPDYIGQGCVQVNWNGRNLLWTNTSGAVQALYDGYGRKVRHLPELGRIFADQPPRFRAVAARVVRRGLDSREMLSLQSADRLYVFAPDI